MALVRNIKEKTKSRHGVQKETVCHASSFIDKDDKCYIQLDTFGSDRKKVKGIASQIIRFDKAAAIQLKTFIEKIFHV